MIITALIVIGITVVCNGQSYDPLNRLQIAKSSEPTEIKDKFGNILLKRDSISDIKWRLGNIDGVDLLKYEIFAEQTYKHVENYKWTKYNLGGSYTNVLLLVDPNNVFAGFSTTDTRQLESPIGASPEDICNNAKIFCFPNKIRPYYLFEKLAKGPRLKTLLSRKCGSAHNNLDKKVDPTAPYPWKAYEACGVKEGEYHVVDANANKWKIKIWNLVGPHKEQPAQVRNAVMKWDKHNKASWNKKKTTNMIPHFTTGDFDVYKDVQQNWVGECVMNSVNTLLQQRFWTNEQYYREFCLIYGGPDTTLCSKEKKKRNKYRSFSPKTVEMAFSKVGAFQYQIDVADLYLVDPNEGHKVLGINIKYKVGGIGWADHVIAFVYKGGHWYYVNSHANKKIRKYPSVLDMIQDIKTDFPKFGEVHIVRLLNTNTHSLTHTPLTVDRVSLLDEKKMIPIKIRNKGGIVKTIHYTAYVKMGTSQNNEPIIYINGELLSLILSITVICCVGIIGCFILGFVVSTSLYKQIN
eukprot:723439_1